MYGPALIEPAHVPNRDIPSVVQEARIGKAAPIASPSRLDPTDVAAPAAGPTLRAFIPVHRPTAAVSPGSTFVDDEPVWRLGPRLSVFYSAERVFFAAACLTAWSKEKIR